MIGSSGVRLTGSLEGGGWVDDGSEMRHANQEQPLNSANLDALAQEHNNAGKKCVRKCFHSC